MVDPKKVDGGTPLQSILYSNDDYDDFMSNSDWDDRSEVLRKTTYSYTEGKSPKPIDNGYGGYSFQPCSDVPVDYRQDNNILTCFEDHYAESFPQVRPHYE